MHLVKDENGNVLSHNHGENLTHVHEHTHADGTVHSHEHVHGAGHEEEHAHTHCAHDCASGCGDAGQCKNETVALLSYMLDHNEHHAAELDQMADNLQKLGMDSAAKQIKDAVADFQKGNLRLSLALTTVKEELKEA